MATKKIARKPLVRSWETDDSTLDVELSCDSNNEANVSVTDGTDSVCFANTIADIDEMIIILSRCKATALAYSEGDDSPAEELEETETEEEELEEEEDAEEEEEDE